MPKRAGIGFVQPGSIKRIVFWGLGIALFLLAMPVVWWFVTAQGARSRIDAELARIRAAGEPVDAADVAAMYAQPAKGKDTTQFWLSAMEILGQRIPPGAEGLPIIGDSNDVVPPPGKAWPKDVQARKLLEQYRGALDLMHQAASRGGQARYSLDFSQGTSMLLPHIGHLRNAGRMLELNARMSARQGDTAGVVESLRTSFALTRSVEKEPVLITQLVRVALDTQTIHVLRELSHQVQLTPQQWESLQADVRAAKIDVRRPFLGERVLMRQQLGPAGGGRSALARLVLAKETEATLELMREVIDAAGQPMPEASRRAKAISKRLKSAKGRILGKGMAALLMPSLEAYLTAVARHQSIVAVADAGIAVERYRLEHRKPPARLEDLVPKYLPKVPTDPLDGTPMQYVRGDGETYSVGGRW